MTFGFGGHQSSVRDTVRPVSLRQTSTYCIYMVKSNKSCKINDLRPSKSTFTCTFLQEATQFGGKLPNLATLILTD